jgi:hypothetical protein
VLANFIDNHDGQRFLYNHSAGGQTLLENALAMVLLYHGLPVVYYGTEQPALAGLADQRTAMFGLHRAGTPMYKFRATIHTIRRTMGFGPGGEDVTTEAAVVPALIPDRHSLVFVRGDIVVLLSNGGHQQHLAGTHNPPHTRLTCVNSSALGLRWHQVCPGTGSEICAGVQILTGDKETCTCRDDKAQLCLSSRTGKPAVLGLKTKA